MATTKNDPLQLPIEHLREVLRMPTANDARRWADQVGSALAEFHRALRAHEAAAEAPNGPITVLNSSNQDTAPILDRKVQQFRFEHLQFIENARDLMERVTFIRNRFESPAREIEEFQKTASALIDRVAEHQEAEEKLMLESITQDTGVGD